MNKNDSGHFLFQLSALGKKFVSGAQEFVISSTSFKIFEGTAYA